MLRSASKTIKEWLWMDIAFSFSGIEMRWIVFYSAAVKDQHMTFIFPSTHLSLYPGFPVWQSWVKAFLSFFESVSPPSGPAPVHLLMSLPACHYGQVMKAAVLLLAPPPASGFLQVGCPNREPPLPPSVLLPLVGSPVQSPLPGPRCRAPPSTQMTWPRAVADHWRWLEICQHGRTGGACNQTLWPGMRCCFLLWVRLHTANLVDNERNKRRGPVSPSLIFMYVMVLSYEIVFMRHASAMAHEMAMSVY